MLPKKAARAMSTTKPAATRRKKSKVLMRRSLRRPTYQMRAKRRRGPSISLALSALAIILFVTGLAINFSVLSKSHEAEAQVASMSNTNSGNDKPDETHPGNIKSYQVGPTMPRFIRIPKLTVEARVKRIGIKANNELQAPTNIFDTGWYDGSSKPGEGAGAALIDAHVSGPTKHGVFYDLKKLVAGDAIQIERGDGKLLNYKVVSSKSFPVDSVDMASTLVSVDPAKPGLNLMTCDGQYDSKTDQYKNRLVVYAVQQ
jgi:LPXTG-site transpeptidase (sortase) family protein